MTAAVDHCDVLLKVKAVLYSPSLEQVFANIGAM